MSKNTRSLTKDSTPIHHEELKIVDSLNKIWAHRQEVIIHFNALASEYGELKRTL